MHSLSPSEAKVAEFCRNNPTLAISLPITAVAKQAGSSVASVSRLAVSLGYSNWKEVKAELATAAREGTANPVFADIRLGDDDRTIAEKIIESNILGLSQTLALLDIRKVGLVVRKLLESKRVILFGSGGSGHIARDEALRISHLIGIHAEAYSEEFEGTLRASTIMKDERVVVFGLSNSGRSRAVVRMVNIAKKRGAYIVGIANNRSTQLEKASDVFFQTAFPPPTVNTASLTARIAVMGIMDIIYALTAHHGDINADEIKRINDDLEKIRFPDPKEKAPNGKTAGQSDDV